MDTEDLIRISPKFLVSSLASETLQRVRQLQIEQLSYIIYRKNVQNVVFILLNHSNHIDFN